jgi:rare lipoprotein A
MRTLRVAVLAIAVGVVCATAQAGELPGSALSVVQHGKASIYADKFHGRRTASGEIMDQNELTAASKNLPLGAHVLVTNLQSGKSVRVRINDRGPYTKGHIIDLSKRAAAELDFDRRVGVVRVRVEADPADQPTAELSEQIQNAAVRQRAR